MCTIVNQSKFICCKDFFYRIPDPCQSYPVFSWCGKTWLRWPVVLDSPCRLRWPVVSDSPCRLRWPVVSDSPCRLLLSTACTICRSPEGNTAMINGPSPTTEGMVWICMSVIANVGKDISCSDEGWAGVAPTPNVEGNSVLVAGWISAPVWGIVTVWPSSLFRLLLFTIQEEMLLIRAIGITAAFPGWIWKLSWFGACFLRTTFFLSLQTGASFCCWILSAGLLLLTPTLWLFRTPIIFSGFFLICGIYSRKINLKICEYFFKK